MGPERPPRPEEPEVGIVSDPRLLRPPRPGRDWLIGAIAERQYGLVTRGQLLAAGIGEGAIAGRVRRHYLHRVHRGVYRVGHTAPIPMAPEMAAVLACGRGAALSHRSAAALWRMLGTQSGPIDVTVTSSQRRRPGLRVHRSRSLTPAQVVALHGIPVTAPARTLLDLAEFAAERELERALGEALVQRLATHDAVAAAVAVAQGRRGAARLRRLLERERGPALTRSEAEERLLALVRAAGLPEPELNVVVAGYEVDFIWRAAALVVEVDAYRFHSSRSAFERDRRRDAELSAERLRVARVTWRQLEEEPYAVVARLARALQPPASD